MRHDEFEAYFQPKIHLASGRIAGAEALARWRHPAFGIVSPAAFIPTLERNGEIDALLRCMLVKSIDFCARMNETGLQTTAAVNVSVESLGRSTSADEITEVVRGRGVKPESLIIEVTESGATTDEGPVLENLTRLRMRGFGLSIDDYGTGYSSMKQLTRVPFTELKIDQSFVTHAAELDSARLILGSSLELARKLNIAAVAEGVETRANWDLLRDLQCELVQGHYIAKPMPVALYLKWAKAWPLMSGP